MKAKSFLVFLVLFFGAALVACFAVEVEPGVLGSQTNKPGVVCVNPNFDFGFVYPEEVVTHRYVLTNQSERMVKLLGVRTTCGCTTAMAATNEVAAGQFTSVDIVINFKGRRGRQSKSIYVETDDPRHRTVRMDFTGVVMVPIEAQPEGVHFGTIGVEGRLEREVLLTSNATNVFNVVSAKSDSPQMTVSVEPRETGRQYLVKIICDGPRKMGTFMTSVEVLTDHPQMRVVSIPVAGFVAGDVVAAPANLLLVPSSANVSNTFWVNLWSPSGKAFRINRMELPGEGLTNSVISLKPDRYRLEIKTWGALAGLDGKAIRIETDLETMRELLIPIRVLTARENKPAGK